MKARTKIYSPVKVKGMEIVGHYTNEDVKGAEANFNTSFESKRIPDMKELMRKVFVTKPINNIKGLRYSFDIDTGRRRQSNAFQINEIAQTPNKHGHITYSKIVKHSDDISIVYITLRDAGEKISDKILDTSSMYAFVVYLDSGNLNSCSLLELDTSDRYINGLRPDLQYSMFRILPEQSWIKYEKIGITPPGPARILSNENKLLKVLYKDR
jgi:hypothetical protein